MKHVLKSLKHNGIYVPPYDLKGFGIKIQGQPIKLTQKSEQMAVAWMPPSLSQLYLPRQGFYEELHAGISGTAKKRKSLIRLLNSFRPKIPCKNR